MKNHFNSQIWKEAPFIRILIPLLTGIALQFFLPISKSHNGFILVFCCFGLGFSLFMPLFSLFGNEWVVGMLIHVIFLCLGRILVDCQQQPTVSTSPELKGNSFLIATLENDPIKRARSFKCTASIRYRCQYNSCAHEKEKIFIYFQTDRPPDRLPAGAVILFNRPLMPIENIPLMDGFDYKRYCRLKHITAQVFLKNRDYAVIGQERDPFGYRLKIWRKKLLGIIRLYVPAAEENGLMEALMIGYTADLDRELVQAYANTGVVHIIAISGLHLTLIYHIIQLLLNRLKGRKLVRWLKFLLVLTILWGFSLLSGGSPSVVRAAVMFTILLFARNLSRESLIYNSLASSAFLLLCFDPFWLWDTGFQLSYLAVLGLVIFLKPIQEALHFQNKLLTWLWSSASVSIAAQILTTPISIYYFHRFPNYFLISNLLAVPLSSAILVGGILLCLFSFSPLLAQAIGWVLGKGVGLLNEFIQYTARLPGAVTEQLSINLTQVFLLYFLIYCLYKYFVFPKW